MRLTAPRTLVERTDIDHHANLKASQFGESLGNGFFFNPTPQVIERDSTGAIRRMTPLPEWQRNAERRLEIAAAQPEPIVGPVLPEVKLLPFAARERLVELMALRLFEMYQATLGDMGSPNPIRDGIPTTRGGQPVFEIDPRNLDIIKKQATPMEVLEWIKAIIGQRFQQLNKKNRWPKGYKKDTVTAGRVN